LPCPLVTDDKVNALTCKLETRSLSAVLETEVARQPTPGCCTVAISLMGFLKKSSPQGAGLRAWDHEALLQIPNVAGKLLVRRFAWV